MSDHYEVYVRPSQANGTPGLLADLSAITGAKFVPVEAEDDGWFIGPPGEREIEVDFHSELMDCEGIPFSSYPICITIHGRADMEFERRLAERIYNGLVAVGRYNCFMVYALGPLLAIHEQ